MKFEDINENLISNHKYQITKQIYENFLQTFGDESPIHIDEEYAIQQGFRSIVMHGSILNGFISHFVGMILPGSTALLQSVNIQFKSPSFLEDFIDIEAKVIQKVESVQVLVLDMQIFNITQNVLVATAKVQVGVRE